MSKLALYWRKIPQRYNLIGTVCDNCGTRYFPPRVICKKCRRNSKIRNFKFSGNGEIASYSVVHAPPQGFEFAKPYVLALIKLDEGPFTTSQIVDCEIKDIEIGKRVKAVFRKVFESGEDGIILYGTKFKLAE